MKLLQVNVVYGQGSTGKIVADINSRLLATGHSSVVCYGRKNAPVTENVYKFATEAEAALTKIANCLGGLMYGGATLATRRLINTIRHEKPDVVHLHCINGYCVNIYRLLTFLADAGIPTVVTHHAEFFYTANCGHALDCMKFTNNPGCGHCPHAREATGARFADRSASSWRKMRDSFSRFDRSKLIFTAVSPWVKNRSLQSDIVRNFDCVVVENGLDTNIFRPSAMSDEISARWPRNGRPVVLHVSASFSDEKGAFKGGDKILDLARMMPDVNFIIVASYNNVSSELPSNVMLWGRASSQQELAALYSAADLTVIASKRETFSMIVAESLCCGTPVIGFEAGGPESIAIPEYTGFVPYGDINALNQVATAMLDRKFDRLSIASKACERYSKERMVNEYLAVYSNIIKNDRKG